MKVGPLTVNWPPGKAETDRYWDLFINAPPTDPNNLVADGLRRVPEGSVYLLKTDIHSPEIMSGHVKEFARFLGAELCGAVRLDSSDDPQRYPFGVVVAFGSDYDPRVARGIGGQAPALRGAFVTFVLGAWIRESGYRATRTGELDGDRLAAAAGLGTLDAAGRLLNPAHGPHVHVADVLLTDLPLTPDGEVLS